MLDPTPNPSPLLHNDRFSTGFSLQAIATPGTTGGKMNCLFNGIALRLIKQNDIPVVLNALTIDNLSTMRSLSLVDFSLSFT